MTWRPSWSRVGLAFLAAAGLGPVAASAQTISAPPRSEPQTRAAGADTRSSARQQVVFNGSFLGGHDDDSLAEGRSPAEGAPITGGTVFADSGLRYSLVKGVHSLLATGRGFVNAYPGTEFDTGAGGDGNVEVVTGSERTQVSGALMLRSDPFFSLGAFGPLAPAVEAGVLPDSSPIAAISLERAVTTAGTASLSQRWGLRHTTQVRYNYTKRDRRGALGRDFTSRDLQLTHSYLVGRNSTIGVAVNDTANDFFRTSGGQSAGQMSTRVAEVRVGRTIRPSRTRRVALSGGVGAQRTQGTLGATAAQYEFWSPTVSASVQTDIGRNWTLASDYRRAVAALDGLGGDAFPSNTFLLRTGGPIARKLSVSASVGSANGQAGAGESLGAYRDYTVTGQASYALAACCAAVVNYSHFEYDVTGAISGLPGDISRSSLRVGVSVTAPQPRAQGTTERGRRSGN